jgi:hypothetical protein
MECEIDDAAALTGVNQGWTGADEFRARKRPSPPPATEDTMTDGQPGRARHV